MPGSSLDRLRKRQNKKNKSRDEVGGEYSHDLAVGCTENQRVTLFVQGQV